MNKTKVVIISLVVVLIVAGVLFWYQRQSKQTTDGQKTGEEKQNVAEYSFGALVKKISTDSISVTVPKVKNDNGTYGYTYVDKTVTIDEGTQISKSVGVGKPAVMAKISDLRVDMTVNVYASGDPERDFVVKAKRIEILPKN